MASAHSINDFKSRLAGARPNLFQVEIYFY